MKENDTDRLLKAESALRLSEERSRLIIENAREYGIFTAGLDRKVSSWNVGAERLLGWSEEEILGQEIDLIFTAEDRAKGAPVMEVQKAISEGRAIDERWHQRKDGSRFWASGFLMPIYGQGDEVIETVKILRDQTEVRQAHDALRQSQSELKQALDEAVAARERAQLAEQTKDHFLAVLSHELRTPLTPILMAVHSLKHLKDLPEEVTDALEMIQRNVQLEAYFIEDLLDLTRITRRKFELDLVPADLHVAVRQAVEISRPDIDAKDQQLEVNLIADRYQVLGDVPRLQQTFWNLLKNASKFSPQGGKIWISSRNDGDRVVVEVRDSGMGIDSDVLPTIFQVFKQGGENITKEYGGLGLGLSIAKAAIDAHSGHIYAVSEGRGKGAMFIVELPVASSPN